MLLKFVHFNMRGRFFLLPAFSAVSLLLLSSIIMEVVLKSLLLSTPVEGAQRNVVAV